MIDEKEPYEPDPDERFESERERIAMSKDFQECEYRVKGATLFSSEMNNCAHALAPFRTRCWYVKDCPMGKRRDK